MKNKYETQSELPLIFSVSNGYFQFQLHWLFACSFLQSAYSRLVISTLLISNNCSKVWSLFLHGNLTTGNKILWKRGEIVSKEQFLLFSTIFQFISNFKSQITYSFVKFGCLIYFFLNSANLICRGNDISKYSESPLDLQVKRC